MAELVVLLLGLILTGILALVKWVFVIAAMPWIVCWIPFIIACIIVCLMQGDFDFDFS
jgi:hypothetical protein